MPPDTPENRDGPFGRLEDETVLVPNPDVVFKQLDDRVVLVHMRTNEIYALNATASRLWELVTSGRSRGELENQMLREFAVEPRVLRHEIDRVIDELLNLGIVVT